MRRGIMNVVPVLLAMVVTLLAVPPAAADDVPAPLPTFSWGEKPSGRVVGSFDSIQQAYWSDAADDWLFTEEVGGLAAWHRGCTEQVGCWSRLTTNPSDQLPAWSPSGYLIAFLRGSGDSRALMILDTRTGEERQVLSTNTTISAPTWSPDEQEIAFSRARLIEPDVGEPYFDDYGLYRTGAFAGATSTRSEPADTLMACAGTGLGLMDVERYNPQWAADGRIFYLREERAAADGFCINTAAAATSPGGSTEVVNQAAAINSGIFSVQAYVEPSPDGSRLAIIRPFTFGESEIVPWIGSSGASVTLGGFPEPASWSPNGRHISIGSNWFDTATGEELPAWVDDPDVGGSVFNPDLPIAPGAARTYDTQCNPGNCMSAIMVVVDGNGVGLGNTVLSGDIDAVLDLTNDSVLVRKPTGTYAVTAAPPAGTSVTQITCDDTNSTGDPASRTATFRLDGGELVVCTFVVGQPDADGDGFPDDLDPCPQDPANSCDDDSDGDGLTDGSDPCPADPTNTCKVKDEPPPPQDRCRTHNAAYQALAAGTSAKVLQFELNDVQWCANGTRALIRNRGAVTYANIVSPYAAALFAVMGIKFKYKGGKVEILQMASGAASISGTGSVSFCAEVPLAGAVVKKGVSAALALLPKPIRKKVADWAIKKIANSSLVPNRVKKKIVILGVAAALRALNASKRERKFVEALVDLAWDKASDGLLTLITDGVCVPKVWTPAIDIAVTPDGTPTVSEHGITGIFTVKPYAP